MESSGKKMYTLSDIAKELGVNKATVSKAISGKGNLSAETRSRILEFIDQCGYKPNAVAQSLARNRTYNIGLMMPDQAGVFDNAFFRDCLNGVCKVASANHYDVLMAMDNERTTQNIARLIDNRKIDGVIAMRSLTKSPIVGFLKKKQVPFVLIGPSSDKTVLRVDNDNHGACRELTALLIRQGARKMALLGGDENNCVTHSRLHGFQEACDQAGLNRDEQMVVLNAVRENQIGEALDIARERNINCVVCMDDYICNLVMVHLRTNGIRVPQEVKVASFYDSILLEHNIPPVTSLHFDAVELGRNACQKLIDRLDGKSEENFCVPGYQILLRGSTK
ncbi:MAG: LacI family DNA-binding transcriptional regulator [Eubacteriales bacterium]|nr:LacI family DNA-binding transcriptional regulator [Eubacteriales bacterium]